MGTSPRGLAEQVIQRLPSSSLIERTEIAGPGFINFFLASEAWVRLIQEIRGTGDKYGSSDIGTGERVLVEFVSSNPTGPLHVGHGRGAAYGDALVRVLRAAGYDTESEYYINDAGRQMEILALSIWLRYLELCGETMHFPEGAYRGDYIFDIAATLHREDGAEHHHGVAKVMDSLPTEIDAGIDLLIDRMKKCVQENEFSRIQDLGSTALVADIQEDLAQFGVEFDTWFSEKSLVVSAISDRMVAKLRDNGHLYEKDGAWWFRSSDFGDEKDRVVVRSNGKSHLFRHRYRLPHGQIGSRVRSVDKHLGRRSSWLYWSDEGSYSCTLIETQIT